MKYINAFEIKGTKYAYFDPPKWLRQLGARRHRIDYDNREAEADRALGIALDHQIEGMHKNLTGISKGLMRNVRKRIRAKAMDCDIDADFIREMVAGQNCQCAVSGLPFIWDTETSGYRGPLRPSVDRIDPSRGYLRDNIRIVTVMVNTAIADWDDEMFFTMVVSVYSKMSQNQKEHFEEVRAQTLSPSAKSVRNEYEKN